METHLLQDLAIVMMIAGAMTLLCHWLKQPVVLGYLVAGLIIGPYTPPFSLVQDHHSIHTMAELGLVFLMFALGLEFNLPKLRRVGLSAALAAFLEVVGMLVIGYALGRIFGWNRVDSIFLGAILSISSTTIIAKVFTDLKMTQETFAQVVFGILILEDIVAVVMLSILSGLGASHHLDAIVPIKALLRVSLFVAFFLIFGLLTVPRFLHRVAGFQSPEVLGVTALGLCLTGALLALQFGFSVALGAFLIGAVIAASREAEAIEHWIHPIRDMFSALFFVAAGMMIQPQLLWIYKWPILIITVVTVIGKIFTVSLGSFLVGYEIKTSSKIGMSLAQIGEFSFVIASLGLSAKLTSDFLYPMAVMISSLTTFLTPYLIRHSDRIVEGVVGRMPAGLQTALDGYQQRLKRLQKGDGASMETLIVSRYLIRLSMYLLFAVGAVLLARLGAFALRMAFPEGPRVAWETGLWGLTALSTLPLFAATAKYLNHILLLLVTSGAPSRLLQRLNIHLFYNTLHVAIIGGLVTVLMAVAAPFFPTAGPPLVIGAAALASALLFRRPIGVVVEKLERLLDDVLGLATSEPTRQAALQAGEKAPFLSDMTEEVVLAENAAALNKTIRDLRLREQTGASIIAIYRHGTHIANPSPDTTLLPDDILVLLGDEEERRKAATLLL